jgi:hypothetical protein
MNKHQAIEAAQQIGVTPGDHVFLQSEGQITHPHGPDQHVDGWRVENVAGQLQAQKVHSYEGR